MMIIMMMMSTDNRNRRHFKTRKKLRDYWICLWDEYHRNSDGIILIFFRPLFAIMHLTGVIIKDTTFLEERLGSTDRNQRYPPTGTHPSPRSVSAWRSDNSSGSLSSTSKLTLFSLIADGQYRATLLGRDKWKELIGSQGSLQYNCEKEGFNVVCSRSGHSKARIGIVSENKNSCGSCDSRIGFGTEGYPDASNTCGNEAVINPDNGDKHLKAMEYILVQ